MLVSCCHLDKSLHLCKVWQRHCLAKELTLLKSLYLRKDLGQTIPKPCIHAGFKIAFLALIFYYDTAGVVGTPRQQADNWVDLIKCLHDGVIDEAEELRVESEETLEDLDSATGSFTYSLEDPESPQAVELESVLAEAWELYDELKAFPSKLDTVPATCANLREIGTPASLVELQGMYSQLQVWQFELTQLADTLAAYLVRLNEMLSGS
jgi:hypothetical protein